MGLKPQEREFHVLLTEPARDLSKLILEVYEIKNVESQAQATLFWIAGVYLRLIHMSEGIFLEER